MLADTMESKSVKGVKKWQMKLIEFLDNNYPV